MATNGIKEIKVSDTNYLIEPTLYTTASGSGSSLTADLTNFELFTGVAVNVSFTANVVADATLNINSTGAKNIKYANANIKANVLLENHIYTFVYNGTNWVLIGEAGSGTYLPLSGGTVTGQITIDHTANTGGELIITKNGVSKMFVGVDSGNSNYGIYNSGASTGKWMMYYDGTDTYFDGLRLNTGTSSYNIAYYSSSTNLTYHKNARFVDETNGKNELVLGNTSTGTTSGRAWGQLALYSDGSKGTYLKSATNSTAWYTATLQAKTGTLALTSDLDDYVAITGDTMTGPLIIKGAAADHPLVARGIAGCNTNGVRGTTDGAEQDFYINYTGGNVQVGGQSTNTTNYFKVAYTTPSSSSSTGALVVSGGAGIGDDLYVNDTVYATYYSGKLVAQQFTSAATLNGTSASFIFYGANGGTAASKIINIGEDSATPDWVGIQVGYSKDKWQLTALSNKLYFRQNDNGGTNTSWNSWKRIADTDDIEAAFAANDAMVYKGTIAGAALSSGNTYGALTPAASCGETYKVSTAGYINGIRVEIGDMFICLVDDTTAATSSNYATIQASWNVIQTNTDGVVIGPASATDNAVVRFDNTTGKLIQNSSVTIDDSGNISANGLTINGDWSSFNFTGISAISSSSIAIARPLWMAAASDTTTINPGIPVAASDLTYNPSTQTLNAVKLTVSGDYGFQYSAMGTASDDLDRPIWFMLSSNNTLVNGTPVCQSYFTYNPATYTLKLGRQNGSNSKAGYINSNYTLYLSSGANSNNTAKTSIIFQQKTSASGSYSETARFNPDSHFIPGTTNTNYLGISSKAWKGLHLASQSNANAEGVMFYNGSTLSARIGANSSGWLGIYGSAKIMLRAQTSSADDGVEITTAAMYPTRNATFSSGWTGMTLGTSSNTWLSVYAKTFYGKATQASTIEVTENNGLMAKLVGTTATLSTSVAADANLYGDSSVYLTATPGKLSSVQYSWNVSGTEKAHTVYNTTDDTIDFVFD